MLEVNDLRSGYGGIPVLMGLSFRVADGEFVGILGHNGMGKTTMLKTLIGLIPTTAGRISVDSEDISSLPPHERVRRGISYVPQGRGILPSLSVMENLQFAAAALGLNVDHVAQVVDEIPRLRPLLGRPGGALSGGEQQLLALARALVQKPKIILLDEPTEGIQPSIIDEIADQLSALRQSRALTLLLVEQNVDFIRALSDRILLIQKGSITNELQPEALTDAAAMGDF